MSSAEDEADVNSKLDAAITDGDVTAILSLVDDERINLDKRDVTHDLQTPLMRMCHMDVERESMERVWSKAEGCVWNPDVHDVIGRTLVMHACIADEVDAVRAALKRGCDISLVDRDGNSAIIFAIRNKSADLLGLLLEHGECSPLLVKANHAGLTPLEIARSEGNTEMLKQLAVHTPADLITSRKVLTVKGQRYSLPITPRSSGTMGGQLGKTMEPHSVRNSNGYCPVVNTDFENKDTVRQVGSDACGFNSERFSFSDAIVQSRNALSPRKNNENKKIPVWETRESFSKASCSHTSPSVMPLTVQTNFEKRCLDSEKPFSKKRLLNREERDFKASDDVSITKNKSTLVQLMRSRKDSLSLPDLRDCKGKLVTQARESILPCDTKKAATPGFSHSIDEGVESADEGVFNRSDSLPDKDNMDGKKSSCSLPPLPSSSADSDHSKERDKRLTRSKKHSQSDDALLRSLIL